MERVIFEDLGRIDYQQAWDYQTQLHKALIEHKQLNRQRKKDNLPSLPQQHYLLFCEHEPVYTLGKSGSIDHLLLNEDGLKAEGFQFYKINRGGDITYHGPGQVVGYPIFDLDCFFTDVHKYVRYLEEAIIRMLADFGISASREQGYTGVWLPQTKDRPKRKICAIGVHLSRWVTMHGFALNVNTALEHFNNIIPCGIAEADKDITSMKEELGETLDMEKVKANLKHHFAALFEYKYLTTEMTK